jgi:hypothetical protein
LLYALVALVAFMAATVAAATALPMRRLRFFLCHTPVIVRIETIEHRAAQRVEFSARDVAVIVRIRPRTLAALAALAATFLVTLTHMIADLLMLGGGDNAVTVRIHTAEMLDRPGEKLIARQVAVIVGVAARPPGLAVIALTSFFAARLVLRAHFFARELAVAIGVGGGEVRCAARVEFLTRQCAVIVGVRLEQAMMAARPWPMTLRNCKTRRTGESRKAGGGEQDFTH